MRRYLLPALAALLGVAGLVLLDRQLARVERAEQQVRAIVERSRAAFEALPTERPVLWGEAVPGNAADDYARAVAFTRSLRDAEELSRQWISARNEAAEDPGAAQTAGVRFTDAMAPALEALRAGTHRARYANLPDWERGTSHPTASLLGERVLANAAAANAERRALEGDGLEAARWALDAAQFAADGMRRVTTIDESIGVALHGIATEVTLRDRGLLLQLDPAALRLLDRGLATLDREDLLLGRGTRGEAVLAGVTMLRDHSPWSEALDYGPLSAWRQGFSTRLAAAELILAQHELGLARERLALQGPEAEARAEPHLKSRFLARAGPLGEQCWTSFSVSLNRRRAVARLRLCRMLVALRLGAAPPQLSDPFGGTLHAERRGNLLRAWSDHAGNKPIEFRLELAAPAAPR